MTIKSIAALLFCFCAFPFQGPADLCLTAEEYRLYQLITEYRKSKGLKSIPLSSKLTRVAQAHVRDLNEHYDFDPSAKCNPHSWSAHGSWTSCCYTNDHRQARCMWDKPKEIAGYPGNGYEIAYYSSSGANAQEALAGWKVSEGHNPLLVNTGIWKDVNWKAVGIGIDDSYGVVWFGEVTDEEVIERCAE